VRREVAAEPNRQLGRQRGPRNKSEDDGCLGMVCGDRATCIPANAAKNPNLSNALKKNQRHRSASAQTSRTINPSLSRGRALGTGPSRRWGSNRAGPRRALREAGRGLFVDRSGNPRNLAGTCVGRRGRNVQTGLFQDLPESPTAPSGRL